MVKSPKNEEKYMSLTYKNNKKYWCHALYLLHKYTNSHESRFNLFGLINQQCTAYMSCGRARTHDHWINSHRLTLSRHTSRQKFDNKQNNCIQEYIQRHLRVRN